MYNKLIKQHNAITTARYDMSAAEKNIVYMLLAQLEDGDPANKVYKVQIRELEKIMDTELKYGQLREATKRLIKQVYTIDSTTQDRALQIGLLTAARHKKGGGIIELEISKKVRPYLFQLKNNFTTFQLQMALSLRSKFSKRIYEMLSQYKDTGIMTITVEELKSRLGLINHETKEEQYVNFRHFETRVLLMAQKELQDPIDISFTYKKTKTGTKVTNLEFAIKYKSERKLTKQEVHDPSLDQIVNRLINKFGLSSWQSQLILKTVPQSEINKTLYDISLKQADGKIKNIGGFAAKIFDNKYNLGLFHKNSNNNRG